MTTWTYGKATAHWVGMSLGLFILAESLVPSGWHLATPTGVRHGAFELWALMPQVGTALAFLVAVLLCRVQARKSYRLFVAAGVAARLILTCASTFPKRLPIFDALPAHALGALLYGCLRTKGDDDFRLPVSRKDRSAR